jgi:hypothetical protein
LPDAPLSYSFFDKAYKFEKMMRYPDRPRQIVTEYDVKKILSDRISLKDSRSDILLQAVDILTNFLRRLHMGRITDPAVVHALGRLQIHRRQGNGVYQSVELLILTDSDPTGYTRLARALRQMSLAGRINDAKLQGPQITVRGRDGHY